MTHTNRDLDASVLRKARRSTASSTSVARWVAAAVARPVVFRRTVLATTFTLALLVLAVPAQAAFPGANGKILVNSNREDNVQLWVMNPNGSDPERLTFVAGSCCGHWSGDGSKIAFQRFPGDIWLMNADGSNQSQVTSSSAFDNVPSISPDGTRIVYNSFRNDRREVRLVNSNGTSDAFVAFGNRPIFSPDGVHIAYQTTNGDVQVRNLSDNSVRNVVTDPFFDAPEDWSPDGTKIVYLHTDFGDTQQYRVVDVNSLADSAVPTLDGRDSDVRFSPDGRKFAFQGDRVGTTTEVFTMNVNGTGLTQLTDSEGFDGVSDWQPTEQPVDATAPVVAIATPTDGATYASGQSVLADYSCADEADGSGIATCEGDVPDGAAIDTSSLGERTFTVTGTDNSANQATETVSYTVTDQTAPTVSITTPKNGANYRTLSNITVDYACADETGGSGLASCTGTLPDGSRLPTGLGALGAHTFTVTGADSAGNTTTRTHTYRVSLLGRG